MDDAVADPDVAWLVQVDPLFQIVALPVKYLYPIVLPVADEHAAVGVYPDVVEQREFAGARSLFAPRQLQLPLGAEPMDPVSSVAV